MFYKDWIGWLLQGLFYESGLFDSTPMIDTIKKYDKGSYKRFFGVGTTDLYSGSYVFFNSSDPEEMDTGIYIGSSRPGIFPYIDYNNFKLVDGTVKIGVDVLHAVDACTDLGYGK